MITPSADTLTEELLNIGGPLAVACALESETGRKFAVVCVWCLHAIDPHEVRHARAAGYGDCLRCPYSGPEIFVALETA